MNACGFAKQFPLCSIAKKPTHCIVQRNGITRRNQHSGNTVLNDFLYRTNIGGNDRLCAKRCFYKRQRHSLIVATQHNNIGNGINNTQVLLPTRKAKVFNLLRSISELFTKRTISNKDAQRTLVA